MTFTFVERYANILLLDFKNTMLGDSLCKSNKWMQSYIGNLLNPFPVLVSKQHLDWGWQGLDLRAEFHCQSQISTFIYLQNYKYFLRNPIHFSFLFPFYLFIHNFLLMNVQCNTKLYAFIFSHLLTKNRGWLRGYWYIIRTYLPT